MGIFWLLIVCLWPYCSSQPVAIVDTGGRAFAILVGRPDAETYLMQCHNAAKAIEVAAQKICQYEPFQKVDHINNRRGNFLAKTFGFSHGLGRKVSIQIWFIIWA